MNEQPVPRLGGLSVIIGFFVPLALFVLLKTGLMYGFLVRPELVLGLVIGSLVVGTVGAIDDIRGVGPWAKLGAQLLAACIAYAFGYRIDAINLPFVGELNLGIAGPLVTIIWFLAITNAINLIDGLDGLAGGIALFACAANICLAIVNQSTLTIVMSTSLAGALLGFLRYNFYPASIFLGDAGSMFLGFVLAATSIVGATTKTSTAMTILMPVIALGVPIMDTLLAMLRRTAARQSIFSADRGHIHHRLLDLGLSHRRVVLTLYGSSVLLATAAIGVALGRTWQVVLAFVVACAVPLMLLLTVTRRQPVYQVNRTRSYIRTLRPLPAREPFATTTAGGGGNDATSQHIVAPCGNCAAGEPCTCRRQTRSA